MLSKDDAVRPSAAECLRHPWFATVSAEDRVPKELRLETLSALMQFQAQSKSHQVLMNLVSSELNVSKLRHVNAIFSRLDPHGEGVLGLRNSRRGSESWASLSRMSARSFGH